MSQMNSSHVIQDSGNVLICSAQFDEIPVYFSYRVQL